MKKRLMTALAASTLTAAMLPAAASADPGLWDYNLQCLVDEGIYLVVYNLDPAPPSVAGQLHREFVRQLDERELECIPGTFEFTRLRVDAA